MKRIYDFEKFLNEAVYNYDWSSNKMKKAWEPNYNKEHKYGSKTHYDYVTRGKEGDKCVACDIEEGQLYVIHEPSEYIIKIEKVHVNDWTEEVKQGKRKLSNPMVVSSITIKYLFKKVGDKYIPATKSNTPYNSIYVTMDGIDTLKAYISELTPEENKFVQEFISQEDQEDTRT